MGQSKKERISELNARSPQNTQAEAWGREKGQKIQKRHKRHMGHNKKGLRYV